MPCRIVSAHEQAPLHDAAFAWIASRGSPARPMPDGHDEADVSREPMSAQGHDAYRTNAIETASPEQLTLMCYDGALRFMRRAARAMDVGERADASYAIGRAQAIVNELNVTLDMEAGGEIASNLRSLYLFVNRHLSESVVAGDGTMVGQAIEIMSELRSAWAEAMNIGAAAA
jgi:flagellar secretion chaperone FliS